MRFTTIFVHHPDLALYQGAEGYGRAASEQAHRDLEMVRRVARGEEEGEEMLR